MCSSDLPNPSRFVQRVHRPSRHRASPLPSVPTQSAPSAPARSALIRSLGRKAGVSLNPSTPEDVLAYVLDRIDLILVMSVNPGFGGQSFIDSALRKVEQARRRIEASGRDIRLEVDGGIKADNIRRVADAGADTFVAGSAIFGQPDYAAVISRMRAALA